jgi:uncharacterized protein
MKWIKLMIIFIFYFFNIFFKASSILLQILPYLIIGTILGELLKYIKLQRFIKGKHKLNIFLSTIIASILGMISPLCTYGTVPVVIELNSSGLPMSVLIVFLISSSMMNPQLFFMTLGGIGIEIALARVISILAFSLIMGWILHLLPRDWVLNKRSLEEQNKKCDITSSEKDFKWKLFGVNILRSLEFTGFYIVIGVIIAAMIEVLVPANVSNIIYQQNRTIQILIMAALSIPFYTCGGGAIPVIKSLISGGMSRGTALAFLNVGSATRVTTIMALASIIRPLFIFVYILILIAFSVIMGTLFV